jgi:glycosyltransferase involved in cell wall biosynthesis
MRVLIIEQASDGGHYLNYVRHLVQAFAPLGCDIVVAVPKPALESMQFKTYLSPHRPLFRLEFIPSRDETITEKRWLIGTLISSWRIILANARAFRALIARVKPDAVYVPTLDRYQVSIRHGMAESLAWWLALRPRLSRLHCEALLLGLPAAYGMTRRSPFITKMGVRTMPFDVVHYIDPVVFDWVLSEVGGKAGRRARLIADPVEPLLLTRSKARAMLRLPNYKKLIMSVGLQDLRKGVDYLIRACARWQPVEPASIVLAGPLSPPIRQLVTNEYQHLVNDGRLIILDRYLSNEEINACCAAGDLIATPYRPQPHPSSIALHGITAGKMVLAANSGWLAYMVPKFSLGRLCDPQDPDLLAEALDLALHEAETYQLSAAAERLVEFHRSENFLIQWRRELSRMMGKKSEDTARCDWKWVLNGEGKKTYSL